MKDFIELEYNKCSQEQKLNLLKKFMFRNTDFVSFLESEFSKRKYKENDKFLINNINVRNHNDLYFGIVLEDLGDKCRYRLMYLNQIFVRTGRESGYTRIIDNSFLYEEKEDEEDLFISYADMKPIPEFIYKVWVMEEFSNGKIKNKFSYTMKFKSVDPDSNELIVKIMEIPFNKELIEFDKIKIDDKSFNVIYEMPEDEIAEFRKNRNLHYS